MWVWNVKRLVRDAEMHSTNAHVSPLDISRVQNRIVTKYEVHDRTSGKISRIREATRA